MQSTGGQKDKASRTPSMLQENGARNSLFLTGSNRTEKGVNLKRNPFGRLKMELFGKRSKFCQGTSVLSTRQ